MTTSKYTVLNDARFVSIKGEDKKDFLQGIITNDINKCTNENILYSCLLTPQGKFISDFFIFKKDEKFIIEIHSFFYEKLLKKISLYKLRSKVLINEKTNLNSYSVFGDLKKDEGTILFTNDPRNKNIGHKLIHEQQHPEILNHFNEIDEKKYHEILIQNTVPLSHYDLEENKSLLLENNFENLNSISWEKGCYIGQEITARMKYRALLKKRIYSLTVKEGSPKVEQSIKENGSDYGKIISIENDSILAMIKIELAEKKINAQQQIKTEEGLILDIIA